MKVRSLEPPTRALSVHQHFGAAVITLTLLSACGGGGNPDAGPAAEQAGAALVTAPPNANPAGDSAGPSSSTDSAGSTDSASTEPQPDAAPDPVRGVTALVENQSVITLRWPDAARAARYDLYWSFDPGVDIQTGNRVENVTAPFKHERLLGGLTHHYVVQAVNAVGLSAPSEEASATLPPSAVSAFRVTSGDSAIALS